MKELNFQQDVIERSQDLPVLVDFWAPWCGPCRVLGPVLEQLAEEQRDRWQLVKVNTEEETELAQQYKIMSIPNVKLFHQGEVVAEFAGAMPKTALQRWLDEHLPDDRKEKLAAILASSSDNETDQIQALQDFVADHPDLPEARVALARRLVFTQADQANELIADIRPGHPLYPEVEDLPTLAELESLENDDHPAAHALQRTKDALQAGNEAEAIQHVLSAVTADKSYRNDLPRRLGIALFRLWGPQHELTQRYRRHFDMALY